MKNVIITQRVEIKADIGERRDCLDQAWAKFLLTCGYCPVPLMNVPDVISPLLESISPCGIIISGGNELQSMGGDTPERDATETALLDYALENGVPVIGVCHGLQMIQDYFGGKLVPVEHHVAVRHDIEINGVRREVNSYHNNGIKELSDALIPLARCTDGTVEAVCHAEGKPLYAMMWHPEREHPFCTEDIELMHKLFK